VRYGMRIYLPGDKELPGEGLTERLKDSVHRHSCKDYLGTVCMDLLLMEEWGSYGHTIDKFTFLLC